MKFTTYPSKPWSEILPGLQQEELDLVRGLVVYESGNRLTADEVSFKLFHCCSACV